MTSIRSDGGGPQQLQPTQMTGVQGTPQATATSDTSADVIEISILKKGKRVIEAVTPELLQALFLMWFTGGSNPIFLQSLSGKAVAGVGGGDDSKPVNNELFQLQVQNKLNEICIGVLNAWSKSIHEDAIALKRKMKEDTLKAEELKSSQNKEDQLRARRMEEDIPKMEKLLKIDAGVQEGLRDYLIRIKTSTDPTVSQDLPFITAALVIGGSMRTEFVGMVDTVTTSQLIITPILEANNRAIQLVAPQDQAIALGYLGALVLSGAAYTALGQTLPMGSVDKKVIDRAFAENYAQKVLDIVDGQGLRTIALALISQSIDPSQNLSEERQVQLYQDVKLVLLSTALALLYKTETSRKDDSGNVIGGGIRSEEFLAMVNGNDKLLDTPLKRQLAGKIRVLLEENPDKGTILASIGSFIDAHKDSSSLIDVETLFANITLDKGPNPMVVGA